MKFQNGNRFLFASNFVLFGTLIWSGCGGSPTTPVSGTVTYNGQNITNANVLFTHKDGGSISTALTDANGNFVLTCFESGDGALPGTHDVAITAIDPTVPDIPAGVEEDSASIFETVGPSKKSKWIIPKKYSSRKTSGLSFTVVKGETNEAVFKIPAE